MLNIKNELIITPEQRKKLDTMFKIGTYKHLHRDKLITDEQLKILIEMQNK